MKAAENIPKLTLHQLLVNPTGKYSAFMSARYKIIEDLQKRYVTLLYKHKNFKFKVYKVKNNYLFQFKIPSEKYDSLFYDVFIEFEYDKEFKNDFTIDNYTLELFSNAQAFTYTYTYVLNSNKMIIDDLKSLCSPIALTQPPSVRNPVEIYGFEKSCYFACKYIQENNLLLKSELDANKVSYSKSIITKECMTQELKIKQYRGMQKSISEAKKKERQQIKEQKASKMETVEEFKKDALKQTKPITRQQKNLPSNQTKKSKIIKPKKNTVKKVTKVKKR